MHTLFLSLFVLIGGALAEISEEYKGNEISGRGLHKLPWAALLIQYAYGSVTALVIIKIILAITFVGMLSALLHMFASIKYLFKDKDPEPLPVYVPHHHSHEVEYAGHDFSEHNYHHKRRHDLTGGRFLKAEPYAAQHEENRRRRKREIEKVLNSDDSQLVKRIARSVEEEQDNCKMKLACELHARARLSPFRTFQLYFIKKDGLAPYWDHDTSRKFNDCGAVYPCGPQSQAINTDIKQQNKVSETEAPPKYFEVGNRRQFNSGSGSYSVEYETQFADQPYSSFQTYDYPQSSYSFAK